MKKSGRPKVVLALSIEENNELVRLTRRANVNRSLAFRARVVLACASGASNSEVAVRLRTSHDRVLARHTHDDAAAIIRTLERTAGRGNFHYVVLL